LVYHLTAQFVADALPRPLQWKCYMS